MLFSFVPEEEVYELSDAVIAARENRFFILSNINRWIDYLLA